MFPNNIFKKMANIFERRNVFMKRKTPALCPDCGQNMIPVVYGFPGPQLIRKSRQGTVKLGGCVIPAEPSKYWCKNCETEAQ